MAMDRQGNLYVLSYVLQGSLNVDGHPVTGYGAQDILLSSFKCDGTYRWSKDIGTNDEDEALTVQTDTLGGVYIVGSIASYGRTVHVSSDTAWGTGPTYKRAWFELCKSAAATNERIQDCLHNNGIKPGQIGRANTLLSIV